MATKELFFEGKTIDIALENAAQSLNADKDMLSYEVVQTATRGIFGIGAAPAKIRVEVECEDEVKASKPAVKTETVKTDAVKKDSVKTEQAKTESAPKADKPLAVPAGYVPEKISKKEPKTQNSAKEAEKKQDKIILERKLSPVAEDDENLPAIRGFLLGLLEQLGITDGAADIALDENGGYYVTLSGSKMGVLIGRRGETLDAAQYLANLAVNRGKEKKIRITLDSENYRAKRIATLESLAGRTADKAIKYKRNQSLEPMGSYERRIIHASLSDREHISTYSVGTEPRRRVIVAYEK